ncbi:hypothetical protein BC835DRAFT_1060318 [Cytidiella melzeri]|nr:hypothetical protein BC835DRAFT_1060318 [Cytidiella melzeri]
MAHINVFETIQNEETEPIRKQFGVHFHEPLIFRTPQRGPFPLAHAHDLHSLKGHLLDYDREVLQNVKTKYTIIVHTFGQIKFQKQKYAHAKPGSKLTLGKVARHVAEVVEELIDERQYHMEGENDSCRLGPGHIEFEELYLFELRQVAKASFKVTLGRLGA